MNCSTVGSHVLQERARFRSVLTAQPHTEGLPQFIRVGDAANLQGIVSDDTSRDDSFALNVGDGSAQVFYGRTMPQDCPAGGAMITRSILYQKTDTSSSRQWTVQTWHRDTVVRARDGEVLSDVASHTVAAYPGSGSARNGVIVSNEVLDHLPLSSAQTTELARWNIAL